MFVALVIGAGQHVDVRVRRPVIGLWVTQILNGGDLRGELPNVDLAVEAGKTAGHVAILTTLEAFRRLAIFLVREQAVLPFQKGGLLDGMGVRLERRVGLGRSYAASAIPSTCPTWG